MRFEFEILEEHVDAGPHPTWNDAAEATLHGLSSIHHDGDHPAMRSIEADELIDLYDNGSIVEIACSALSQLEQDAFETGGASKLVAVEREIHKILCRKQADYGCENILRFGTDGLKVRIWDKIARLINLRKKGVQPFNESLNDTYIDLIGYTVIAYMLENGWFELPLQFELPMQDS